MTQSLSAADLEALERIARRAAPSGLWESVHTEEGSLVIVKEVIHLDAPTLTLPGKPELIAWVESTGEDADLIAACAPDVVLRLIAHARSAQPPTWQPISQPPTTPQWVFIRYRTGGVTRAWWHPAGTNIEEGMFDYWMPEPPLPIAPTDGAR